VRVWPEQVFDRAKLRLMGATHFYLFGRTACLLFAQFFMLSLVARMGETALAANAVLWQIWSLVSFSVDGFAHAAETLVGNALGSRNFSEARQIARQCLVWGTGLGLGYTLAYAVAMDPIVQVFTDHAEVVSTAVALTFWVSAIMPLNGALFILDGVFIGANDLRYVFGAMILVVFGVFLPFILLFVYVLGWELEGVWVGTNVLMVGRFGSLYYRYRGDRWVQTFVD
jgi:MATE family multidrug resistance protein